MGQEQYAAYEAEKGADEATLGDIEEVEEVVVLEGPEVPAPAEGTPVEGEDEGDGLGEPEGDTEAEADGGEEPF